MKIINLKENQPTVELALANFLIELEVAKLEKENCVKFIHGYGSHGVGGAILLEIRKKCFALKKQRKIKTYFTGSQWDISNPECFEYLINIKDLNDDEDLNNSNPGITVVIL